MVQIPTCIDGFSSDCPRIIDGYSKSVGTFKPICIV